MSEDQSLIADCHFVWPYSVRVDGNRGNLFRIVRWIAPEMPDMADCGSRLKHIVGAVVEGRCGSPGDEASVVPGKEFNHVAIPVDGKRSVIVDASRQIHQAQWCKLIGYKGNLPVLMHPNFGLAEVVAPCWTALGISNLNPGFSVGKQAVSRCCQPGENVQCIQLALRDSAILQ